MKTTPLGLRITEEKRRNGWGLKDLTVLAAMNDPYRIDTPASHRDAQWLVDQMRRLKARRPIHLRGVHYLLVSVADVIRPNGLPYVNDEPCWRWLQGNAADAARWLNYIPWDAIRDGRNEAPVLIEAPESLPPRASVSFRLYVDVPDDIEPTVYVDEFRSRQPFQIVLIGEKASIGDVLAPVAGKYKASLALPSGEISDTMVHQIVEHIARDGRPAVCFYFSDFDPAGHQMPISFARKVQAFRDLKFPDIKVQVFAAAMTADQVKTYGLSSTPLKETEKRGDRWVEAFGVEQTEIDALAALRPHILRQIAEDAIAPFFDRTLAGRCRDARETYQEEAESRLSEMADSSRIEALRDQYSALVETFRPQIEDLQREMEQEIDWFEDLGMGDPAVPQAEVHGEPASPPIFDTDWDWSEASRRLKARKAYEQ